MDKATVTAIVDALAVTIAILAGRFLTPNDVELVKALVFAWQPIAITLIVYFTHLQNLAVRVKELESEERVAKLYNPPSK